MVINVHAGHNPDGKVACGAIGFIKESVEDRIVKDKVISLLRAQGHTVYDCTCENGTSQQDILQKIVAMCNSHSVDLDVSIHFNAGASKTANGKTTGTEVYVYSATGKAAPYAKRTVDAIAELGFTNRGVKVSTGLYVLKNTKSPAMLVECCFVDDPDDVKLYDATKMAEAIAYGISGEKTTASTTVSGEIYRVRKSWDDATTQIGAYSVLDNAKAAADANPGYYVYDSDGNKVYPADDSANTSSYSGLYRVRKSWDDATSQIGAYSILDNAKEAADANAGTFVFTENGVCIYPVPYIITATNNIYYYTDNTGAIRAGTAPKGTYTIVEVDSTYTYGKLKSGAGWIKLSDVQKA